MFHTEEERRNHVREIAEDLLKLADDDSKTIRFASGSIKSSFCSTCKDYADDIHEEFRVSYSSKKEEE